jgi:UDP-N-acetylglucosamine 1-carboxyvinyltransferase
MEQLRIIGGTPLHGKIRISGAKNAALPLMTAALLTDEPLMLSNFPDLADIKTLTLLLSQMGVHIHLQEQNGDLTAQIEARNITTTRAPYDLVRKMRASILVLGPLVARTGQAEVSLPGGCAIGARPVNLHIMGLEKMGAHITIEKGYIFAKAPQGLKGADITFPMVSVTGTENLMMAATLAKGTTRLMNAACEPEVTNLAECLIQMGAKIEGLGTSTLTIQGVDRLQGATHQVLPDRIETGTYAMAAAATRGSVELLNTSLDLLPTVQQVLEKSGIRFDSLPNGFRVTAPQERLKRVDITTDPYPGYPTDLQAQLTALMTLAQGTSRISETIFENRFMHVPELCRMGADISLSSNTAIVRGVPLLKGAQVMATDLRASVSLVIAGLAAQGETIINRIYHLDRGYEDIDNKLRACGAQIERSRERVDEKEERVEQSA